MGALWAELKRRRVVRAVLIYLVAGWVVIEVASTVMPNLNLPEWSATLVTVLIALGLPLVVILAWVFDVGPEGIERTDASQPEQAPVPASQPRENSTRPTAAADEQERRSVAVLPFVNMSGDASNEYFSDGISEEILNLLTKLPQLRVASRTSSFAFKGKDFDIPTVAEKLGVSTVLEGSVRRAGDHVRITAQLIDTETDSHLWSETYDRELKDVFAIQDDIAHSIVQALKVTLTPKERRSIQYVATSDPKAFDFYLRGRQYMYSMVKRDYEHAIRMFEQAIDLDSKYALAYAGIADARSHLYRYADATPDNAARALDASEKAVTLDPDSAEAHASKGLALFIGEKYDEAEAEFERAIELNPNLFESYYYYGLACSSKGDFAKAVEMYREAMEVNPNDYQSPLFLAQAYSSMGRRQDEMRVRLASLNTIQRHLELNPHDTRALYCAANNLVSIGEKEKGREMAERALGQDENEPVVLYNVACFYAMQGNSDRSLELLERAVEQGWGDRAWLETDSDLNSLRDNPRFKELLEKVD
ncbi:MAG: tetratricopeptide repeat protein [Xanthomonadales bacterium]|nr:tetratricopeptide repeat protein [Xanthomonadales bacterium]